jgi:hypothetical protein
MSVLKITYILEGQKIAPKLEEYCEGQKKQVLRPSVDLGASATSVQMGTSPILDRIAEIKKLGDQIAKDGSINKRTKDDFFNFLACVSLQHKRALQGNFTPTSMTTASLHPGQLLSGLQGVRVA